MLTATTMRALILLLPLTAVWLLWLWRRPEKQAQMGIFLACAWLTWSLYLLHLGAAHWRWWSFQAEGGLVGGLPVDLLIGWVLLWGALPLMAFPRLSVWMIFACVLLFDLSLMPWLAPILVLGPNWLVGELLGLAFCFLPAYWLAKSTAQNRQLTRRICLLALTFGGCLFFVLPLIILDVTGGSWEVVWQRPWWLNNLLLQCLAIPFLLGLSAMLEFAYQGEGTPLPFDPPQRLVTTGLYAYLANPMQTSTALAFLGLGLFLQNGFVAGAGVITFIYGLSFARWSETGDMEARFGPLWLEYQQQVRPWWPRWRPYRLPGRDGARLFVAESCLPCSQVAAWFLRRRPVGLDILPAETHPGRALTRMTYESGDGRIRASGVAAFARALEHIHFGWALLGVVMRLPVIRPFLQLIIDAAGGGPRNLPRHSS